MTEQTTRTQTPMECDCSTMQKQSKGFITFESHFSFIYFPFLFLTQTQQSLYSLQTSTISILKRNKQLRIRA